MTQDWQPIKTVPTESREFLLYFPADTRRNVPATIRIDWYPRRYPRRPTHWMPLPDPPVSASPEEP